MQIFDLCVIIFSVCFVENAVLAKGFALDGAERFPKEREMCLFAAVLMLLNTALTEALGWTLNEYIFTEHPHMAIVTTALTSVLVMLLMLYILSKLKPEVYLGIKPFSLLLTANPASVGIVFTVTKHDLGFTDALVAAVLSVFGVFISYLIFSDISEKIYEKRQPRALRGLPSLLLAAGLLAMVFSGITGISFPVL